MATEAKRQRILEEVYATLPTVDCKGLCFESCAAVPAYDVEVRNLLRVSKRAAIPFLEGGTPDGTKIIATNQLVDPSCPFLVLRRCTVYEARPLICRIFGVAAGLPCQYGCTPATILTDEEVMAIQKKLAKL